MKSVELALRGKIVTREPGRDGKALSDHREGGNVAKGGIGILAR